MLSNVAVSVFSIIRQTTLPLREIAPMTVVLATHSRDVLLLVPVAVLVLTAKNGFIYFDDAQQFLEIVVLHTGMQYMAEVASGMQRRVSGQRTSVDSDKTKHLSSFAAS